MTPSIAADITALREKAKGLIECAKEDENHDTQYMLICDAAMLFVLAELLEQNEMAMAALTYTTMDTDCREWVVDICPQLFPVLEEIARANNHFTKDTGANKQ